MKESDIKDVMAWVLDRGLAGASETELLHGTCDRCLDAGLVLSRAITVIDTLHPIHEGRAFRWRNDGVEESAVIEYGRTTEGEAAENWRRSVFYYLLNGSENELRRRIGGEDPIDFSFLDTLKNEGQTDFIAFLHRFGDEGIIGEMDCVYSQWTTNVPGGFDDNEISGLRRIVRPLALSIKSASLARVAKTLVDVYLGHDPGQRVLSGRISRGMTDRISAVLWFSDLHGYTSISDSAQPDEIIPLLNDYAEAVISSVHDAGGDVLKLIGDGVLAIFDAEDAADACRCALKAEAKLRKRIETLNVRRAAEGRPITTVYLGLHIGDVFYGNIGSPARLDFTVVGPAVNEVSRIASLCSSIDRNTVMSAEFVAATPEPERGQVVSVGRYALRGVGRAKELFTLDPEIEGHIAAQ